MTKYGYDVFSVEAGALVAVSSVKHDTPELAEQDAREHHLSIYRPGTVTVNICEVVSGVAGKPFGEDRSNVVKRIGN